ncbi:uncharacterized protein SPAPADRAFT_62824, partial [Spathaspora passalidarum NRRL Y-27907]
MKDIREIIHSKRLVMDGALGTQLEPFIPKTPLWSGFAVLAKPEILAQVHREYIISGADIIATATYQLSQNLLRQHTDLTDGQIEGIWESAINIALEAIDNRDVLVMGSIGPYSASLGSGAEYSNNIDVSNEFLQAYHIPLFQYFSDNAKVDLIGLETVSTLQEFVVFHEFNHTKPYYISIISNDGDNLPDGTSLSELVSYIDSHSDEWFIGLGINCTEYTLISKMVERIHLPVILNPNLGYIVEGDNARPKEKNDYEWIRGVTNWLQNDNVRIV